MGPKSLLEGLLRKIFFSFLLRTVLALYFLCKDVILGAAAAILQPCMGDMADMLRMAEWKDGKSHLSLSCYTKLGTVCLQTIC